MDQRAGAGGWILTEECRSCLSKRGAGGLTLTDGQRQAFAAVDKDRDGRIT